MADEKWAQIHSQRIPFSPKPNRLVTPLILNPTCPEHCSGRHEIDGVVQCPHCQVPAYKVVLHAWPHTSGQYWNSLAPMNGAPPVTGSTTPTCNCGREMVRVWK